MSVDKKWFDELILKNGLSQRRLAKQLKIDPSAMNLMLKGTRKMSAGEASGIARILGVDVSEVLERAGVVNPNAAVNPTAIKVKSEKNQPKREAPQANDDNDMMDIPVPLSDHALAKLSLPRRLTKTDAEKISAVVKALASGE